MDGTQVITGVICFPGCHATGVLNTDFTEWRINGKLVGDHRFGSVTWSPSISVFGGQTDVDQSYVQNRFFTNVPPTLFETYTAAVALGWTDIGVKLGLDTRLDVTPMFAVGLGGSIGVAHREVSLNARDSIRFGGGAPFGTSAISRSDDVTAVLANLEARLFFTPWRNVTLKGFVGVNYDDSVAGITAPSFASAFLPPGTGITPSTIGYDILTSYYAGGGVTVKF